MNKYFAFLLLVLLFFIGYVDREFVVLDDKKIYVEIVDSVEERKNGLMFRKSLCENCGMLFIFKEEEKLSFWMKNTLIPLNIIFISEDLKVVDMATLEPCRKDPCETYTSKEKALFVLEVNKNTFDKGIIGKKISKNI